MRPFWERRLDWLPTWNMQTDSRDMQIDYIRVYDFDPTAHHSNKGDDAATVCNSL